MSVLDERRVVLFTSVGNEALHGFVRDLREHAPRWELVGTDVREDAAGRYLCDHHETSPRRDDPGHLEYLRDLVARRGVDLVVPLSTEDQDWFCRGEVHTALSPAVVLTSSEAAVGVANRKTALFAHLSDRPHLLPDHVLVDGPAVAVQAIDRLVDEHGAALLKSDAGTGGRGMVCIGEPSADPAPAAGRTFLSMDAWRELVNAPAALREAVAPSVWGPGARWPQLAVAYLPGDEFSADALADAGRTIAGVVRRRSAAIGGLATTARVVDDGDVAAAACEVIEAVGLSHVVNVQFRRDAGGIPRLLEVNPRTPGTIGLTVAAGYDLPLGAFVRALGGTMEFPETPVFGLECYRFQGMVLNDGRRV